MGCEVAFEAARGLADHLRTARAAAKQNVQDRPVSSVLMASARPARYTCWEEFWYGTDEEPPVWVAIAMLIFIFFVVMYFGVGWRPV